MFETAIEIYGSNIFAYYYDIPFEETIKRHQTKDNKNEFGETKMRQWWNEKDFISIISEKTFTKEVSLDKALETILNDIL